MKDVKVCLIFVRSKYKSFKIGLLITSMDVLHRALLPVAGT